MGQNIIRDNLGHKNQVKRILIIKPSSLGDIIHGLPVLGAIRDKWPEAKIAWLVKEVYADILHGNPYIDELILLKKDTLTTSFFPFRKKLHKARFDLVVDIQGLFRSGLISYLSGAPMRVGFHNGRELSTVFYTHKIDVPINLHAVDRNLKLVASLGCEIQKVKFPLNKNKKTLQGVSDFFKRNQLETKKPLIILVPGGRWEKKRWPAEFFSKLGFLLSKELQAGIVMVGSSQERSLVQGIKKSMQVPSAVAIDIPLSNLVGILGKSDLVVTNDSGPMHIASAAGIPVVALFGPTNPDLTGPYTERQLVISKNMECSPCYRKRCIQNSFECMESITVEEVFEGVKHILKW